MDRQRLSAIFGMIIGGKTKNESADEKMLGDVKND